MEKRYGPMDGSTYQRTDVPTDRPTDKPSYRDAWEHPKKEKSNQESKLMQYQTDRPTNGHSQGYIGIYDKYTVGTTMRPRLAVNLTEEHIFFFYSLGIIFSAALFGCTHASL